MACIAHEKPRPARIIAIYTALVVGNALTWGVAVIAFHAHPALLGTALLAYVLGIRHAMDVDHLAAIDNVTRKLMHDGQRPLTAGLHFSLGHSTVVFLACLMAAVAASAFEHRLPAMMRWGSVIGTAVSAFFLLLIAVGNMRIVAQVYRSRCRARHTLSAAPPAVPRPFGAFSRLFQPLFGIVRKSWHMYPLGVLFGLGFDTATEVALLGISAIQAAHGVPWQSILIFPLLFAAGMSMVDTLDGIVMSQAYAWALTQSERRHRYDMTITMASIFAALLVGVVELFGMALPHGAALGAFWKALDRFNQHSGVLGGLMIGFFLVMWTVFAIRTVNKTITPP